MEQDLREWAAQGRQLRLPAWDELPSIPLYMDQVILYLKDSLSWFEDDGDPLLTSSMINNYVKHGVLPHPEKKKYGRQHLAGLLTVCMLKPVLRMEEIKALLGEEGVTPERYETLRREQQAALAAACAELEDRCTGGEDLKTQALSMAIRANALRANAQRILSQEEEKA